MTFRDVTIKNLSANIRRYLSYFLCCSFTIMVFFIFSTTYFNKSLYEFSVKTEFIYMIYMGIIALFLFSVFFINYAHNSFIKARCAEFGLLMTLGMTKKNISRMIWIENIIILSGSFVIGIISGVLFSRLFFLVIYKLVPAAGLSYYLDYKSFALTSIVFLLIYLVAIVTGRRTIIKLSIFELLKRPRKSFDRTGNLWLGIIGIALFIGSFVLAIVVAQHENFSNMGYMYPVYAVIAFFALYLILDNIGSLYLKFIRTNRKRYYGHLLSFSEKKYNFRKNKGIIFVLCILSAMFIFFVASPFALLSISRNMAEEGRDTDIQFVQFDEINMIDEGKLADIVNNGETPLVQEKELNLLLLSYKEADGLISKPVISDSTYQRINGIGSGVKEGEILELVTTWVPGYTEISEYKEITMTAGAFERTFKVADKRENYSMSAKGINLEVFPSKITLVINDSDYQELLQVLDSKYVGVIRQFNFENWEKTELIIKELEDNLNNYSKEYPVDSVITAYENGKSIYSMMIFFTSFMGILFFISGGCILFFKQYSDMDYYKKIYKKLSHIGVTGKELTKLYASAIRELFFAPIFMGFIISYAIIHMTTYIMGGGIEIGSFFLYAVIITLIYGLIQSIYYILSIQRFKRSVLDEF